jgi:hypothetical protein
MSSGNVTLHPFISGAAAILRACPERAQRVERETSLDISVLRKPRITETVRDSSTSVGMTKKLHFYCSFERELGGTGQGHVGKLVPCPLKTDGELAAAANRDTDRSISLFGRGKYQRAGNNTRSARERFVFDAALVSSQQNVLRARFLNKIHVCACRRKYFVTPNGFASPANIDIVDFGNRDNDVRHTAVNEVRIFFLSIRGQIDPEP